MKNKNNIRRFKKQRRNKRIKKYLSGKNHLALIFLVLILSMTALSGCAKKEEVTSPDLAEQETTSPEVPEESGTRIITDMSGREVEIPNKVNKVYSTSPVGQIFVYTINPDKISGLNFELSEVEAKYMVDGYGDLPILGGWFGKGKTGNIEEILKADPDIILSMGDLLVENTDDADALEKQTGKPVVMIDGDLENSADSYKFLGEIMDEEERTKLLADYCNDTFEEAKKISSGMSEEEKITVYYAEGPEGLQTEPRKSRRSQPLEIAGVVNIADIGSETGYGRSDISIEQLLNWDPDKIIIGKDMDLESTTYKLITNDDKWENLKAVKEGQVYEVPDIPYNFTDRPPSVNRVIGIKWLGNLFYPEKFKYDIEEEISKFYKLFYHYDIQEGDLDEILINAKSK